MTERTDSATRPTLNRARVLHAAIELADQEGLDALTMRALAARLGVKAMSLYNHVENKDDIIDGMLDTVVGTVELPETDMEWKTAIRRTVIATKDVLISHPWAPGLWLSRQSDGQARLRLGDWMLRTLTEAGLERELIYHAYHILESHIVGSTMQAQSFPYRGEELAGMARDFIAQVPAGDYPDLVDHIKEHLEPRDGQMSGFEFALDLILDGLERARDGV